MKAMNRNRYFITAATIAEPKIPSHSIRRSSPIKAPITAPMVFIP